ncbi:MAG: hypothetical protein M3Y48_07835 [Actinomycetota bacterium]|nr:hypothetical protein [Actinomycetota bacterium]
MNSERAGTVAAAPGAHAHRSGRDSSSPTSAGTVRVTEDALTVLHTVVIEWSS